MSFDFTQTYTFENDRARINALKSDDFEDLSNIAFHDTNLLQYSPAEIDDAEKLNNYIAIALQERLNKSRYAFTIFDKAANVYAGCTSFYAVSNADERLAIGYTWIGKAFQGSDLNRNCKFLMMQFAFETFGFNRVELHTDERNAQSRAAIRKIGGVEEGILRQFTMMPNGFRRNTVTFSILRSEWTELKTTIFKDLAA